MRYYLKRCGFQELGSVKNGHPQRGRYLLTSMDALDFFPPLSATQLNDSALLPILPLYSGKKIYCSYVWHNDKFHDSAAIHPRNEYRIYLNRQLENNCLLFEKDDIVIIRSADITEDAKIQTVYLLDIVRDKNSSLYRELNAIIDGDQIRGAYGIIEDGYIHEFEHKAESILRKYDSTTLIDDSVTSRIEKTDLNVLADLFNAVSFRDFVMAGYESLCAVTGTLIRYNGYLNLEAAHIRPKSRGGLFLPNNGIALSRDMHWAFDKGFFTLNNEYKIIVHPQTGSDFLRSFDGKYIRLPKDPFFRPAADNIAYHAENIYGLFLTSGKL